MVQTRPVRSALERWGARVRGDFSSYLAR